MSATDDAVIRSTTRRIVLQATAMVAAAVFLLCGLTAFFVTHTQHVAVDRSLSQAVSDPDTATDPPSGILAYAQRDGRIIASPELHGVPFDRSVFDEVALGGAARTEDIFRNGREYRVRTQKLDDRTVQVGYDLTEQHHERNRLFIALIIAAVVGVVMAGVIAGVIARRAIAPLALAFDRQRRFVADASHELRTPLTQAHTRAQLLLRELDGSSSQPQVVDDARRLVNSTRQLGEIVDEMLMSAQLRAEPQKLQPVDVATLARAAVDAETDRARQRGISLRVEADGGPHMVAGHPTALRRVLNSLLDNAIGHSPDSGEIIVSIRQQSAAVQIVVRDHGVGLVGVDPRSVFDRFTRGSHGAGRRYGLGLALVREVVVAHHGEVTAENAEGGGAQFTVRLPAWRSETADQTV